MLAVQHQPEGDGGQGEKNRGAMPPHKLLDDFSAGVSGPSITDGERRSEWTIGMLKANASHVVSWILTSQLIEVSYYDPKPEMGASVTQKFVIDIDVSTIAAFDILECLLLLSVALAGLLNTAPITNKFAPI